MKILAPKYIFTGREILKDFAIAFEKEIVEIDRLENLKSKFPDSEIEEMRENSFLMAGLINSHIHLEYSHHTTEYDYGTYMGWLSSVVKNFPNLSQKVNSEAMEMALNEMIKSGTTYIGAVSSMGLDFQPLKSSPIRKTIFNEIIASQPHQVDDLYKLWLGRVEESEELKDEKLTPAVAVHSPFSVHPVVVKRVVALAKERNYRVSAHFMESQAERDWLDNESGEFRDFYLNNYGVAKKFTTAEEFLNQFERVPTLFTHGVYLNESEINKIAENGHSISHCPVSNRVLGGDRLDIDRLKKSRISWNISTDGYSSNSSLNLFDEMRSALFLHNTQDLESFSFELFQSATIKPAKELKLNCGELAIGKDSDMILIDLENLEFDRVEKIPLHIILRGANVYKSYIFGENILEDRD